VELRTNAVTLGIIANYKLTSIFVFYKQNNILDRGTRGTTTQYKRKRRKWDKHPKNRKQKSKQQPIIKYNKNIRPQEPTPNRHQQPTPKPASLRHQTATSRQQQCINQQPETIIEQQPASNNQK
jgi:hypothetical protein